MGLIALYMNLSVRHLFCVKLSDQKHTVWSCRANSRLHESVRPMRQDFAARHLLGLNCSVKNALYLVVWPKYYLSSQARTMSVCQAKHAWHQIVQPNNTQYPIAQPNTYSVKLSGQVHMVSSCPAKIHRRIQLSCSLHMSAMTVQKKGENKICVAV